MATNSCTKVCPNLFRNSVSVIRADDSARDEYGGSYTTETVVTTIVAHIKPKSGSERFGADHLQHAQTHMLWAWWNPQVEVTDILQWDDPFTGRTRRFRIIALHNVDELGQYLEISAEERTGT